MKEMNGKEVDQRRRGWLKEESGQWKVKMRGKICNVGREIGQVEEKTRKEMWREEKSSK